MADSTPVILDTDPGIDDAVALALAARAAGLKLVGVATSYGNAELAGTTRNARHILDLAGATDIAVRPGAATPLCRSADIPPGRHGPDGVGNAPVGPARTVTANPEALLELLARSSRAVTIAVLGPPTNLAHALEREPKLVLRKVAQVVAMLGNFGTPASPDRHADFNTWCDPEAASLLLGSGLPLRLLPVDVATHFTLSRDVVVGWQRADDPLAQWLAAAVGWRLETGNCRTVTLPDVTAVAALLDPRVLTLAKRRLSIDLDEGPTRGRTWERDDGVAVAVATSVAVWRVRELVTAIVRAGRTAGTGEETQ